MFRFTGFVVLFLAPIGGISAPAEEPQGTVGRGAQRVYLSIKALEHAVPGRHEGNSQSAACFYIGFHSLAMTDLHHLVEANEADLDKEAVGWEKKLKAESEKLSGYCGVRTTAVFGEEKPATLPVNDNDALEKSVSELLRLVGNLKASL